MKVDFGDFRFLRIDPHAVQYVSGVATASPTSGGLYKTKYLFIPRCLQNSDFILFNLLFLLSLPMVSEFSSEEFRIAKVDPIYQFSKPITVWPSASD